MRANSWQKLYGAKRRAIDRAILAEAEASQKPQDAQISFSASPYRPTPKRPPTASLGAQTMREAIARAFGRPLT